MRQLIKGRQLVDDPWFYVGKDEGEPGEQQVLPLADYLAARQAGVDPAKAAVRLVPTDLKLEPLAPHVASLPLVVIEFASTGDGRGYTQATLLRERFGYRGELRAFGGVRIDQIFFMARCGFDSFELLPGEKPELAIAQLERFSVAYQNAPDGLIHPRRRYGA